MEKYELREVLIYNSYYDLCKFSARIVLNIFLLPIMFR